MFCEECKKPRDDLSKNNTDCGYPSCKNFAHKLCLNKNQVSKSGFFYCKTHIKEIPIENVKSNPEIGLINQENHKENRNETLVSPPKDVQNVKNVEKQLPLYPKNTDNDKIVPYDDGSETNPFANFVCEICACTFTKTAVGVLCENCGTCFHRNCLHPSEIVNVKKSRFLCQDCLQDNIRIDRINSKDSSKGFEKSKKKYRGRKILNSTPNLIKLKENRKINLETTSNSSSSSSVDSSESESDRNKKLYAKYKKLKKLIKKRKVQSSSSEQSSEDSEEENISQEFAMINLYKLTQEERNKSKFEKLPVVEQTDTKWSVFFDLFDKSRKYFSHSENILRLQKSIKSKEILDIGGISLFDPRTYWEALKMINKRLCHSHNLLQKETNDIIRLKKLKYDSDPKKVIELINKIINYSHIVKKYGTKKHQLDDRVICHIGNILPNNIVTGWYKIKAKREEKEKTVSLKHIAEYLSKQVGHLTSKIHGEELDPWKENFAFKSPQPYVSRKTYHFDDRQNISFDSDNYCWVHKTKSHSAFKCSKLWALSGQEVTKLARENNVCTFCGYKRHKTCHAAKKLNCKIDGCKYKHHILFCFQRKGKTDQKRSSNNYEHFKNTAPKNFESKNKNRNSERFSKSTEQNEKNSFHREDEVKNDASTSQSDESEINIPQSNFYINNPPKTIKVKSARNNTATQESHINGHFRGEVVTLNALYNVKSKNTASCILGVIVVKIMNTDKDIALLLDSGSTVSLIDQKVADKLELKGVWNPLKLNWSNNISKMDYGSRIIKVQACTLNQNAKQFNLYMRTVNELNMHDQPFDKNEILEFYPHLRELNLQSYCKIDGIIGLDNMWAFDQHKIFKPKEWKPHIPYGIRSPLGDYVVGNVNQLEDIYAFLRNSNENNHFNVNFFAHELKMTEEEEREFRALENSLLGAEYNKLEANDNDLYYDTLALEILKEKVRKSDDNVHYEAPLL